MEDLVKLAEKYCKHYHKGQKRKGGDKPYATHPFAVRDILVRHGYTEPETQIIALLHDTIEDTDLEKSKRDIDEIFGTVVYEGVYALSNNTSGKHAEEFKPLFESQGVQYTDEDGLLTEQAYKLRILFSRDTIRRIKIADMIHNTSTLAALSKEGIEKKLRDADSFYIPLGKSVAPDMVQELIRNVTEYRQSEHYMEVFGSGPDTPGV